MGIFLGLLYVILVVLLIVYFKSHMWNITILTFCYFVMIVIFSKYDEIINSIWQTTLKMGRYVSELEFKIHLYLLFNISLIGIGIFIFIYLLIRERKKREPYRKESWGNFKEYIFRDGIIPILLSLFIIVLGMVGAGFVNILNAELDSSFDLIRFILSGSVGLILIFIGLGIISPLVEFKFRYDFLKNYENNTAQFIYNLRTRSENIKNINLGIISFQLFELTKTTSENNIVYEFQEVWRNDSKYDKIRNFRPKKIVVPFEIIDFFKRDTITQIDIKQLNKFTTKKFVARLSKHRTYVPTVFLRALYDLLFELYYKEKIPDEQYLLRDIDVLREHRLILKEFNKWIIDWKVNKNVFKKSNRYKSIHYINLFEIVDFVPIKFSKKDDSVINVLSVNNKSKINNLFDDLMKEIKNSSNEEKENLLKRLEWIKRWHQKDITSIEIEQLNYAKRLVNFSLLRNYKGGDSKKENRGYYNLCIETESASEGTRRFVLLLIADKRAINEESALNLFENVLQLNKLTLGGDN
ncbi:hypothetical protein ACQCVP_08330 [Rossellomorea vietnamensis]|uniref:hypothetical protein n=1 Tax=Rossellomorea vietnamensis TaxID=218284 RepID=UPI003CFA5546